MRKLRNTIVTLLITLAMITSTFPIMAFAQSWYNNEESDEIIMDETNENTEENLPGYEETDPYLEDQNTIEDTKDTTVGEEPQLEEIAPETISLTIHFVDSYDNTKEIGNLVYDNLALEDSVDYSKDVSKEAEKYIEQNYYQMNDDSITGIIGSGDFVPNESDNIDLYVNLEYRPYTVTFNYLEEGTENELQSQKLEKIPFGDYDYSKIDNPKIKDYEFVEMTGDVKGTIEAIPGEKETIESAAQKSIVINVYYKKINDEKPAKDLKVIFNYYDELTSEKIDKSDVAYFPSLDSIEYDTPEFKGYTFHHVVELIYADGTVEINLFYGKAEVSGEYRVKINYLEEGTDKVLSDAFISIKVPGGFKYDVTCKDALHIPGYKYVKTAGDVKGTVNDKDVVINVYYKKVQQYTVTVNYIDFNNKKSIYKSFVSVPLNEGENYSVTKLNGLKLNGYKYYKTTGDPLEGTINENKVINVYYLKNGETAVKTGDYNNIMLWSGIGIVALVLVVILGMKNKSMKK